MKKTKQNKIKLQVGIIFAILQAKYVSKKQTIFSHQKKMKNDFITLLDFNA